MRGIHHVTAISGRPTRNLDFYARTLGLRFVKKTVNFDDPGTYHFYYGDEAGSPGTILTFFPWEHASSGRGGLGLAQTTAFCVPAASIGYWTHRLIEKGVKHEALTKRFGEPVLSFFDPDGMSLALVGISGTEAEAAWSTGEIPAQHAIRGFHGVTLMLDAAAPTGAILTDVLGFTEAGREGPHVRYRANDGIGGVVDIREARGFLAGRMGRGSVHHVAFRAADAAEQAEMARKLVKSHGVHPTEQKDRQYFRSVYFREPGGVLFEIATDLPGFTIDEPLANLGQNLKLPPFLEPRRKELEAVLPSLELVS
ncbi:MAG: ring-cleaving dioxygenase [Alphaproteobacteria bacterium]|nr:MAG: ring-cleaving dioxygenase [Alphaproteobacteria bacterium]